MFDTVPARMVQFTRRSPRFSAVMQDLFAGKTDVSGVVSAAQADDEKFRKTLS